jgi:hypothetical protein
VEGLGVGEAVGVVVGTGVGEHDAATQLQSVTPAAYEGHGQFAKAEPSITAAGFGSEMVTRAWHPLKADEPMVVTEVGITTVSRLALRKNEYGSIVASEVGKLTNRKFGHINPTLAPRDVSRFDDARSNEVTPDSRNACVPIDTTAVPIAIEVRVVQPMNAAVPITVTESGTAKDVRAEALKAKSPIVVTEFGMVMVVRRVAP